MQRKLNLAVIALCCSVYASAQDTLNVNQGRRPGDMGEAAFTFTEAQLGEDDDMSQNVTILNSNSNIYASQVGYLFSPARFRYRAFNQKYNEIFINNAPMNDLESGQFRYSMIGGLNNQTRNVEFSLPFEDNNFSMSAMGGSNNYNFRPSKLPTGSRATVSLANRNYMLRGMFTHNTGLSDKGWALSAGVTYRWAEEGYVEGTFYNSLSYFLGVEKVFNEKHSLSLVTWGNPTERASQGGATDESYWIANDQFYNPYWGYQNGKKRNSRIVHDFAPTALLTWDFNINDKMSLTTALSGKYSKYKSTKLNYNNSDNPQPDYWKLLPSSYYNVWDESDVSHRTEQALADWHTAYNFLASAKENRQINWDRLYYSNQQVSKQGGDAMYYIQAKNNDQLAFNLSSTLKTELSKNSNLHLGMVLSTTKGMHYQTMEDLLGASSYHNINTYALGNYPAGSDKIQYDLNNPNAPVGEGDKFGYNYNILVDKATAWATYSGNYKSVHGFISGRISGTQMQRDGKMRNGLAADNSYGKSGTGHFLDGGAKGGATINLGRGNTLSLGVGYEWRTPTASTAFASPEINNDFVTDLKNEKVFSSEIGYQLRTSWLTANISGYYSHISDATEWQCFYFDDINSFSYVSLTGISKDYYGVEYGLNFKVTPAFSVKAIGTFSEAKYASNANVRYMNSTQGTYGTDICYMENVRESGTPLFANSIVLSYHSGGWYIDLNGNYYDRIFLSPSVYYRYGEVLNKLGAADNNGVISTPDQHEGNGGFMLDASIGKSIYLKHGRLSVNLMVTNLLNNTRICTGGYEQSRSDVTSSGNSRGYVFSMNPKKYYAYGINGMLNITYRF